MSGTTSTRTPRSLQARLLMTVLALVVVAWATAAALAWHETDDEVSDLLDAHLAQTAALLRIQPLDELDEEKARLVTDDCSLFELTGRPVQLTQGDYANLKITTLEDIPTAERIAEEILGRDPKEEARARMHALLAQAAGQMHR